MPPGGVIKDGLIAVMAALVPVMTIRGLVLFAGQGSDDGGRTASHKAGHNGGKAMPHHSVMRGLDPRIYDEAQQGTAYDCTS